MPFIVDFKNDTPEDYIAGYMTRCGCVVIKEFSNLSKVYLVEGQPQEDPQVEHIVLDAPETSLDLKAVPMRSFETTNDDNWWKMLVLTGIDLEQDEVSFKLGGDGIKVYLLDSGINEAHPEFEGSDITLLHSLQGADFSDTSGHGTALASVIVGQTCGITNAALRVVKIFHQGVATLMSDILAALDAVAADYAASPNDLAIINMSWAVDKNEYLEAKIADMIDLGIIPVVAAGNSGVEIENVTPASMPGAITVGSFGQDLAPSDFTNYTGSSTSLTHGQTNHGELDLLAPGEAIRVALPDGSYGYTAGTSIAAAITSAIGALNIHNVGYTWDIDMGDERIDELVRDMGLKDLLTLGEQYSECVNLVPAANMTRLVGRTSPGRMLIQGGRQTTYNVFAAGFYESAEVLAAPSWFALEKGYAIVDVPMPTERIEEHSVSLKLINGLGEEEILNLKIVSFRDDLTMEEAKQDSIANLQMYELSSSCDTFCHYYCCQCCGSKPYDQCAFCYRPVGGCNNPADCQ